MNKELAIHHLLKMYNRKPDDRSVMNYMEVCRDHSNEDVISAVKMLVNMSEVLPYPRTLLDVLTRQFDNRSKEEECSECRGKGYAVDDRKVDGNGLENFSHGAVSRCYCRANAGGEMPDFYPKGQARRETFAAIFAGEIAKRSVDNEVISSPAQWGKYMWNKENFDAFCVLAEDMTMLELVVVIDVLKGFNATDCQAMPLEVAKEAKEKVKRMPKKSVFNVVTR